MNIQRNRFLCITQTGTLYRHLCNVLGVLRFIHEIVISADVHYHFVYYQRPMQMLSSLQTIHPI